MVTPRNRPIWTACGVAVLLLAGVVIHLRTEPVGKTHAVTQPPPARKPSISTESRGTSTRRPSLPALQNLPDLPAPLVSPNPTDSAANQEWIEKRVDELDDLAWFDDAESLKKILAELRNPLPEIRTAALEAVKDFGSRDAIPYLEAISRETKDPLEQKAIRDLIEHLDLPTMLEQSAWDSIE